MLEARGAAAFQVIGLAFFSWFQGHRSPIAQFSAGAEISACAVPVICRTVQTAPFSGLVNVVMSVGSPRPPA